MALIIRIDVDRPYGRQPVVRHVLSRLSSDFYLPRMRPFGYLKELAVILRMLNSQKARGYVFFRRCTRPSKVIVDLMAQGGHEIGLHLENSRSRDTFLAEKSALERHVGCSIFALSKHGSGDRKYGMHHFAPYEPEKYVSWAKQSGMRLFLGNLETPTIHGSVDEAGFRAYPGAYWLEPPWRDVRQFDQSWLLAEARLRHVVLLIHPENVLADPVLLQQFNELVSSLETTILE